MTGPLYCDGEAKSSAVDGGSELQKHKKNLL